MELDLHPDDLQRLAQKEVQSIIDDYVRLQHPSTRNRTYLNEAFLNARDALFDSTFLFSTFKTEENQDMSMQDLLDICMSDDTMKLPVLQKYCVTAAHDFWKERPLNTLKVTDDVTFDGHSYHVFHSEDETYIDFDDQIIYCNKKDSTLHQEQFMKLLMQLVAFHLELKVPQKTLIEFGGAVFRLLRMNDAFRK